MDLPAIEIKDLHISFHQESIPAVAGISFHINKGELLAMVGESGSGKSVTALSIPGLLPAGTIITGEVLFSEEKMDLLKIDKKKLRSIRGRRIAMIFQEPMTSLNPVFTCGSQVVEAILAHNRISSVDARQRAEELFKIVELPDPAGMLKRYPHELSGGQKQRVMIAMAMSCNPELIIADEPTTALDVRVQKNILVLLKKLQSEYGLSILLITHDLGLVAHVADRIIVMHKGKILEEGKAFEVLKHPAHPYTKALLECRPGAQSKGKSLPVINDSFTLSKPVSQTQNVLPEIKAVLKVENLCVSYKSKNSLFKKQKNNLPAVNDVSFTVNSNEVVGLVGESGSGKTTLGKALLRLISPDSGNIVINGTDISHLSDKNLRSLRKQIQIVFQDPYGSLNPRLSIGEAIMEPLNAHNLHSRPDRKQKVQELLERVKIHPDNFHRYPHQFSGGQRQRISIARALSLDPAFIVFDESVSALDVSIQAQVLNLINELRRDFQFSALFISHDLSVVHYISDRIIVLKDGRIVEQGISDDVFFRPQNPYTRELIESIPSTQ